MTPHTAEKRIRLLAFDVPYDTRVEELDMPVSSVWPKGCVILWTSWNFRANCLVAGVYHPNFPEVDTFSVLEVTTRVDRAF